MSFLAVDLYTTLLFSHMHPYVEDIYNIVKRLGSEVHSCCYELAVFHGGRTINLDLLVTDMLHAKYPHL